MSASPGLDSVTGVLLPHPASHSESHPHVQHEKVGHPSLRKHGHLSTQPESVTTDISFAPLMSGYNKTQIKHAYGFDQMPQYRGAGQTIAIVDAYNDPTIASDLHTFNVANGIPDSTFIVTATAGHFPAAPPPGSTWNLETALDVEWAHAIAPLATIILVEAQSSSLTDLLVGVDYATQTGAQTVSMSWGISAPALAQAGYNATTLDAHFNHPATTYIAASGDGGFGASYPAGSPLVTAVGGTNLYLDASGNRLTAETGWSNSGGGAFISEPEPSIQRPFRGPSLYNGTPTVSYNAGLPVEVYDSQDGGWVQATGTSAGAPQWAGLVAVANSGRAGVGKGAIGGKLNQDLYQLAGGTSYTNPYGDFLDITTGSNGQPATPGYDVVTGLGSPVAAKLVPDLINRV